MHSEKRIRKRVRSNRLLITTITVWSSVVDVFLQPRKLFPYGLGNFFPCCGNFTQKVTTGGGTDIDNDTGYPVANGIRMRPVFLLTDKQENAASRIPSAQQIGL